MKERLLTAEHSASLTQYDADGRRPVAELYSAFRSLARRGWIEKTVATPSRGRGGAAPDLPILSFRTQGAGHAVWIISGIHGEEPAGPEAIAEGIGFIRALGEDMPAVLLPLCNPLGYFSNWRYLDRPDWEEGAQVSSAGDAEHVLPATDGTGKPRLPAPSSPEAAALVAHVLELARTHPPALTLDLHEDNLLDEGYIYSQGRHGAQDGIARGIIEVLSAAGVPVRREGKTRFGEEIANGIAGPQADGSLDELLAAEDIIVDGKPARGPAAETVIVVETPAAAMPLAARRRAHLAVLEHLRETAKQRLTGKAALP